MGDIIVIRRSVILLALLLAACNLSVPDVTPTIAPTRTPSPTLLVSNTPQPTIVAQVASSTPSNTPSVTATFFILPSDTFTPPTVTRTNQPSTTPSFTPTLTLTRTPTSTFTATRTPTETLTNAPSATSSFTPTNTATSTPLPTDTPTIPPTETLLPSPTPLPLVPTDTPTLTPSLTLTFTNEPTATPTFTPSLTPRPLPTATRTLSPEELATFTVSAPIAPVGQPPTPTQADLALVPTLDATPTFITAEAPIIETPLVTPIPAQTTPQEVLATATAQPTVALIVTLPGVVTAIPIAPIGFNPPNAQNRVFGLSTSGGVTSGGFSLLNDTVLFERNPVDPNLYVTTDSSGNLYLTGLNGAGAYRPDMSPFSQFVALTRDENNAFVPRAKWSPDGRFVAFIVAGKKTGNDGVWFFQPGQFPPVQLLVDCLPLDVPGCSLVSNPYDPDKWESQSLLWSPNSDAVLVSLNLPAENNRGGIVIVSAVNDPNYRITRPPVYRYDYGSWSRDGQYILVSGRGPDMHEYVGWLNRDGSFAKLLIDSEAAGLWMGFASQANDGSVYALGAPGDRNGPREALHIYNMSGQAITGAIGSGFPDRVEWSPDGHAVFVQTGGRQYIANINGEVRDISGQVAGARAINWVNGELPQGNDGGGSGVAPVGQPDTSGQLPQGVVEGTEYQPGTQLRVYVQELNIRQSPGVNSPLMRDLPLTTGDYVVILAGPVDMDGARWWQVQTADGLVGWIAGAINGSPTLGQ